MSLPLFCFLENRVSPKFPDVELALDEPDGLLAAGGDLNPQCLMQAYQHGIFPWYDEGQPILWWSPDPRSIILPEQLHISHSLNKTLRKQLFSITFDRAFEQTISACASVPRQGQKGTWLTEEMLEAYNQLHTLGHAHSVECWHQNELVGGLYGIAIGKVFFGESMFSTHTDASKIAMVHLSRWLTNWGYELIDCQISNPHLTRMGATEIPRQKFIGLIDRLCTQHVSDEAWQL